MSPQALKYQLLQLLLDRLASEGRSLGVDTHLRLHELLGQLPADYPPARLRDVLAPVLTKTREEQQAFYDLFDETLAELQKWHEALSQETDSTETPAAREERNWRWLAAVLATVLVLGLGLVAWNALRHPVVSDPVFSQSVGLYDRQPAYVRGDTLLAGVDSVVFAENGRLDSLQHPLVYYHLEDSVRLVLTPRDTVGIDSVSLWLYNPQGDSLRWTVHSVLQPGQLPVVTEKIPGSTATRLFQPIDTLPFPHDVFTLAIDPPDPGQQFIATNLPWLKAAFLGLATALLVVLLIWRDRRRRKLVAELEQTNKPPYIWDIKFAEPAEIDFGEQLGVLLNRLRQRTTAEHQDLDVPATIDATIDSGGMVDFRYRRQTRPPEYLLLIDEEHRHNHRARLFDELYARFQAEEVLITRYFYHGDLRLCFNEAHPHGISLPELAGKHPDTRLLVLGSGQGLLSPLSGQLSRWSELLKHWDERALLSPIPSGEWGRREAQLQQLLPVLPARLESLAFLIEQLDAGEEGELDRWRQATRHQPLPPLQLGTAGLIASLKAHFTPGLFNWIAACAVYPRLQFTLTCQLGQLLSSPEEKLLTAENLTRLNQLPWFVEGRMPPAVRLLLLDYLEREDPALLLRVRNFLYTSLEASAPPPDSVAASEHRLQLALNEWFFTQDARRRAALEKQIRDELRAGADADFTVVKFLEGERGPLDFIVPDSWKKYLSYSDYPALDWQDLKRDLRWALPLWLLLLVSTLWYQPAPPELCIGIKILYQEKELCLDSYQDFLWLYEQFAIDSIANGSLEVYDDFLETISLISKGQYEVPDPSPLVKSIWLNKFDDESGDSNIPSESFIANVREVHQNLATTLYNQGVALHQINKDSACQYFARAVALDSTAQWPWTRAAAWCRNDQRPIASFSTSAQPCCAPCELAFTDQSQNTLVSSWDFGDGGPGEILSGVAAFSHTYDTPGTYTITLVVSNAERQHDTLQQNIRIQKCEEPEPPPIPTPAGPGQCRQVGPAVNFSIALRNRTLSQAELSAVEANRNGDLAQTTLLTNIPKGDTLTLHDSTALHYLVSYQGQTGYLVRYYNEETVLVPCQSPPATSVPASEAAATSGDTLRGPIATTPGDSLAPAVPATTFYIKPDMVRIPGGTFEMGDTFGEGEENELPVHTVSLTSFSMSRTEVTFAAYDAFCTATGREKPADEGWGRGQRPVINISWYDAVAYCNWLSAQEGLSPTYTINGEEVRANWEANGYRLPTEAEWEYAARQGGEPVRFGNGKNIADPKEINFRATKAFQESFSLIGDYRKQSVTVTSLQNPNQIGLHEMSGNLWEWCWDYYRTDYYENSLSIAPRGPLSGFRRVVRGGSWHDYPSRCRAAHRDASESTDRANDLGFRLASNSSFLPCQINQKFAVEVFCTESTRDKYYQDISEQATQLGFTVNPHQYASPPSRSKTICHGASPEAQRAAKCLQQALVEELGIAMTVAECVSTGNTDTIFIYFD